MTIPIGAIIKKRRKEMGLSQITLADMACIYRTTVGKIESGASVKMDNVLSCLGALGLKVDIVEVEHYDGANDNL